jgi:hypothetical protein
MEIDIVCPVCARSSEDGGHLFFKCKLAKQVWNLLAMEDKRKKLAVQKLGYRCCLDHLGGERRACSVDGHYPVVSLD